MHCSRIIAHMIQRNVRKLRKRTEEDPDASKEETMEVPRPEMHPASPRKGVKEGAWGPRGVPEARQNPELWKNLNVVDVFHYTKNIFPNTTPLMRLSKTTPPRGSGDRHQDSNICTKHKREPHFPQIGHHEKQMFKMMNKCKDEKRKTEFVHLSSDTGILGNMVPEAW